MNAYQKTFESTEGRLVLRDLERISNSTKINADRPDSNAAVWKCAQQSLLQRIYNQLSENTE